MSQVFRFLPPMYRPGLSSQLPVLAWPSLGHCIYLGVNQMETPSLINRYYLPKNGLDTEQLFFSHSYHFTHVEEK